MPHDSALQAIQAAVYAALNGDATLDALLDGTNDGVFDAIPEENTAQKYVLLGEAIESPDHTFGKFGHDVALTIHSYAEDANKQSGNKVAHDINDRVVEVLDGAALTIAGHALVTIEQSNTVVFPRDGVWRHVATDFRVLLEDS